MSTNMQAKPNTAPPTKEALMFASLAAETMAYAWGRWQDEKEYEKISDYTILFKGHAARTGVKLVKMTSRPFQLTFTVNEKVFVLYCRGGNVGYRRVK